MHGEVQLQAGLPDADLAVHSVRTAACWPCPRLPAERLLWLAARRGQEQPTRESDSGRPPRDPAHIFLQGGDRARFERRRRDQDLPAQKSPRARLGAGRTRTPVGFTRRSSSATCTACRRPWPRTRSACAERDWRASADRTLNTRLRETTDARSGYTTVPVFPGDRTCPSPSALATRWARERAHP